MATELIGAGGLTVQLRKAYDRKLLSRFRAEAVYNRFGIQRGIPANNGKNLSFRRMDIIAPVGTLAWASGVAALAEGTAGAEINATWAEVTATVSQYGQYMRFSDLADAQSIDQVMAESVDNLSETMKDYMEMVTRDILTAGTNIQYASTSTSRATVASGMKMTLAELREAKRTLKKANARPVEDGKFIVIATPDVAYDLEGDTNITNYWVYGGAGSKQEQGFDASMKDLPLGFRLYEANNARVFLSLGLSGADVHATLVFGAEWFGTVKIDALPAKIIQHGFGSSGAFDPLDQVATIGWKCSHAAAILNQNLGVRIESVATGGFQSG